MAMAVRVAGLRMYHTRFHPNQSESETAFWSVLDIAVARLDHKVQRFTRQACQEAGVPDISRLLAPFVGETRLRMLRYVDFAKPHTLWQEAPQISESLPRIQGELLDFLKSPDSETHKHWRLDDMESDEDNEDDEEIRSRAEIVKPEKAFAEFAAGIACLAETRLFAGQPNIDQLRVEGNEAAGRLRSTYVHGFRQLVDFTPGDRHDVCPLECTWYRPLYESLKQQLELARGLADSGGLKQHLAGVEGLTNLCKFELPHVEKLIDSALTPENLTPGYYNKDPQEHRKRRDLMHDYY